MDATATLVSQYEPDIVFNATTPFPWWTMDQFPERVRQLSYSAGLGMWCAVDCLLPLRLSEALAEVVRPPLYVNACYPDMVNAFLRHCPNGPTLGIGNMSNLVPGLTLTFAQILDVPAQEISIRLVAHHFTSLNAPTIGGCGGAPYYLSVAHGGREMTFREPDDTPFAELKARFTRIRGLDGQGVTVSSAATILASLLLRERRRHHAPGPNGLVGGYPVVVAENGGVELDLPLGLDRDGAVGINEAAQKRDGLAAVGPGTVALTVQSRDALKTITGVELPTVTLSNVQELAEAVVSSLNSRYGLGLSL
jgi:hypothetical protein